MTAQIFDFNERRKRRQEKCDQGQIEAADYGEYDGHVCPQCGGGWFRVEEVCMSKQGDVGGWAGQPVCTSCDTPSWPPSSPSTEW